LFNSDEEIGSPDSLALINTLFPGAKSGFVFEPGRIKNNSLVTARKGILTLGIEIKGRPAHAGSAPEKGINAITEAARIILALNALNDPDEGITIGCNVIHGGVAANVVAEHCILEVDIRYRLPEQKAVLDAALEVLLASPSASGATITSRIRHGRPPLVKTTASDKLFEYYSRVSKRLGLPCGEVTSGGVSDANFLSHLGIPVLDGVGAIGDHSHTQKEYTVKKTITKRIEIFCTFMAEQIAAA
jgi:glutamate carboxypeptidase